MSFARFLGIASFAISSAQAAVSSTGFTVSLTDVDYFLPPKPVANIAGCEGLKSLFEDDIFAPFTVLSGNLTVSSFADDDDVWQEGFLEGTDLSTRARLSMILTYSSDLYAKWQQAYECFQHGLDRNSIKCVGTWALLHQRDR